MYIIYIRMNEDNISIPVYGDEIAWEVYHKALELADMTGTYAAIVDGDTGEVLADSD